MTENTTKISVVISAYNAEKYIIDSVNSLLSQTLSDFEILIMDDGSTDRTHEFLSKIHDPRVHLFRQKNLGKASAINTLLMRAKGEYIAIQDADDLSDKNRLKILSQYLDENQHIAAVLSGYYLIINKNLSAPRRVSLDEEKCKQAVLQQKLPSLDPTMMVRTNIALETLFNEELLLCQGLDFLLKIGERYPIFVTPEPLYFYRSYTQSTTKKKYKERVNFLYQVTFQAKKRLQQTPISKDSFYKINDHYSADRFNNLSAHFLDSTYWSIVFSLRGEAIKTALLSCQWGIKTKKLVYFKPLVYAVLPLLIIKRIKGLKKT